MEQSVKCCKPGIPFGTVCIQGSGDEIHVKFHDVPCCTKEFETFLELLRSARLRIGVRPFYLLYDLDKCVFNQAYIKEQEAILDGATCCAILSSNSAKRFAIRLAIGTVGKKKKRTTETRIFPNRAAGVEWIREHKAQSSTKRGL
jgi:hypothetical protein